MEYKNFVQNKQISENIFNFVLFYINEKNMRTTNEQARLLGYRRIKYLPLDFFRILSRNDISIPEDGNIDDVAINYKDALKIISESKLPETIKNSNKNLNIFNKNYSKDNNS